jgi:urease accessory protein
MIEAHALARLLRLASPALPVGAFGYSQGLEAAIAQGWLKDEADIAGWLEDVLEFSLARFEAPVFCRLHRAWERGDSTAVAQWNELFLAARETAEFRAETVQTGASLRTLLTSTGEFAPQLLQPLASLAAPAFPTAFAFAAVQWNVPLQAALTGYLFAWAENQVSAAVKTMRLGHIGAQRILGRVAAALPGLVESACNLADDEMSNFTPGLAIASCLHETQASRVFRS